MTAIYAFVPNFRFIALDLSPTNLMNVSVSICKQFAPTLFLGGFFILVMLAWWHSSRYSERHLHYFGKRSVEVFSASSLLRISFVNGHIGSPHPQRGYRQRNVSGKFAFRPTVPGFRVGAGIWEISLGYWHLGLMTLTGVIVAFGLDLRRIGRANSDAVGEATGRN